MNDCTPTPQKLHTVVPDKGEPGDSSGYMGFSPEPGEPLVWRYRFPFRGNLFVAEIDGIRPAEIRYRKATTGAALQDVAFTLLAGAVEVERGETIEVEVSTTQLGAAVTFRYQQIKATL